MAYLEYKPRTTLFHYCGPGGFEGITSSRTIWLSDLQYANDPKELQLHVVIQNLMLELIQDTNTAPDLRGPYKSIVVRMENYRRHAGLNSFSLSLKGDQLPMWQEYTDRGKGFCIGFRATAFNDMPIRVQKVKYVAPNYFGSIHREVEAIVRPLLSKYSEQIGQIVAASEVVALASSVKDETWRHEAEVRLLFSSSVRPADLGEGNLLPIGLLGNGKPVFPEDPQYRERQGLQVPYHVKPFGRLHEGKWDASGAIEKIIIGPNNTRSIDEVREYLIGLGYTKFDVIKSRCAFR